MGRDGKKKPPETVLLGNIVDEDIATVPSLIFTSPPYLASNNKTRDTHIFEKFRLIFPPSKRLLWNFNDNLEMEDSTKVSQKCHFIRVF